MGAFDPSPTASPPAAARGRLPTDRWGAWAWWRARVEGRLGPDEPLTTEPQCGFFKKRDRGRWIAASIDLLQDIDPDTGELVSDERLVCIVDGVERDTDEMWAYVASFPIPQDEHERLARQPVVTDLSKVVIV